MCSLQMNLKIRLEKGLFEKMYNLYWPVTSLIGHLFSSGTTWMVIFSLQKGVATQKRCYSRSCHQRPCFCQTKKVVGDRKSLVTGMSFCCKICGCGGRFNVGLMTFTHHWPVVIVDQSTRLRQHFNACSNITDYEEHYAHTKMFVPSMSQQTQYVKSMLV